MALGRSAGAGRCGYWVGLEGDRSDKTNVAEAQLTPESYIIHSNWYNIEFYNTVVAKK